MNMSKMKNLVQGQSMKKKRKKGKLATPKIRSRAAIEKLRMWRALPHWSRTMK